MEYYQKLERPVANESEAVQLKDWKNCKLFKTRNYWYRESKPTLE